VGVPEFVGIRSAQRVRGKLGRGGMHPTAAAGAAAAVRTRKSRASAVRVGAGTRTADLPTVVGVRRWGGRGGAGTPLSLGGGRQPPPPPRRRGAAPSTTTRRTTMSLIAESVAREIIRALRAPMEKIRKQDAREVRVAALHLTDDGSQLLDDLQGNGFGDEVHGSSPELRFTRPLPLCGPPGRPAPAAFTPPHPNPLPNGERGRIRHPSPGSADPTRTGSGAPTLARPDRSCAHQRRVRPRNPSPVTRHRHPVTRFGGPDARTLRCAP